MIKAAFFDLDGTLITSGGIFTPAVRDALDCLRKKGILTVAATGRSPYELRSTGMIDGLKFDAVVSLNGQYCYDRNGVIHWKLFDREDLARILTQNEKTPIPCAFVEKDDMYINYVDDRVRLAMADFHTPPPEIRDISGVLEREILMLMVYLPQEQLERDLLPVLQNSDVTRWNRYAVDVLPYLLDLMIVYALGVVLDSERYSDDAILAAEKLARLCRISLIAMVVSNLAYHGLQLLFVKSLMQTNSVVQLPLFSLLFVLAVLLVTRLLNDNRQLKEDNDLFI